MNVGVSCDGNRKYQTTDNGLSSAMQADTDHGDERSSTKPVSSNSAAATQRTTRMTKYRPTFHRLDIFQYVQRMHQRRPASAAVEITPANRSAVRCMQ
jgi:hypothetical protein